MFIFCVGCKYSPHPPLGFRAIRPESGRESNILLARATPTYLQKSAQAHESKGVDFRSCARERTKSAEVTGNAMVIFCGASKSPETREKARVGVLVRKKECARY